MYLTGSGKGEASTETEISLPGTASVLVLLALFDCLSPIELLLLLFDRDNESLLEILLSLLESCDS